MLVEGQDDLYAIVQLMASHVNWGDKRQDWPVVIEAYGGVEKILASGSISVELKSPKVDTLGIVVDADEDFAGRWQRLRSLCGVAAPGLPPDMPTDGLITQTGDGKRLGIWIMPDNVSRGMLETFLRYLVPEPEEPIWLRAQEAVAGAVADGAKCRPHHVDKSNIYTWMAWQDPPGQSFGTALVSKVLDSRAPQALPFVKWFRDLYEL
ncbi:MAG TPA: DUF3226 domain-containing protein [Skermanella sp.]|nr:DUF3226 domain-containing protein [Skermanella sp.]